MSDFPLPIQRKCCRILLQRLCSTFQYNPKNLYREEAHYVLFPVNEYGETGWKAAWEICGVGMPREKYRREYLIVLYDVPEYRIVKRLGIHGPRLGFDYGCKLNNWKEEDLGKKHIPKGKWDVERPSMWITLCEMSQEILGEDLTKVAHTLLRSQMFLDEIWQKIYHPDSVERAIQRLGSLEAYINDPESGSPICILRPHA